MLPLVTQNAVVQTIILFLTTVPDFLRHAFVIRSASRATIAAVTFTMFAVRSIIVKAFVYSWYNICMTMVGIIGIARIWMSFALAMHIT